MAERKSIKNYDVLDDITGQEDDIALMGYKISNSTTRGVLASALGGADSGVYDKVIRTQQEFDELRASPTWLGAVSVALVGEFATVDGIQIPLTVKQIHGFNGAKITFIEGSFGYSTRPDADKGYEIRNLAVEGGSEYDAAISCCTNLTNCTGTSAVTSEEGTFYSCTNLTNCTCTGEEGCGFNSCTNLTNCTCTGEEGTFYSCTNLTNCTGTSFYASVFNECTNLTNCEGTSEEGQTFNMCTNLSNCTSAASGEEGGAFYDCTNLTNCEGMNTGTNEYGTVFSGGSNLSNCKGTSFYGVVFNDINIASNCKGSWGTGANTNIDADTCPEYTAP